jgi:hypothetical protein
LNQQEGDEQERHPRPLRRLAAKQQSRRKRNDHGREYPKALGLKLMKPRGTKAVGQKP